jgi:hypothetical protein
LYGEAGHVTRNQTERKQRQAVTLVTRIGIPAAPISSTA